MECRPAGGGGPDPALQVQAARDAALRFLAYRARSEAEVRRRLLRRFSPDVVERVVAALKQQRFLDDAAFAQQWRHNRERHRPRARNLVRQELRQLGVSSDDAGSALADFDDQANAYEAASRQARRLLSRGCTREELHRKLWSHLRQRGFSARDIRGAIGDVLAALGPDFLDGQENADRDEK